MRRRMRALVVAMLLCLGATVGGLGAGTAAAGDLSTGYCDDHPDGTVVTDAHGGLYHCVHVTGHGWVWSPWRPAEP